jgi:NAD(P)-dependent dehydrogenase (short-subunit alcohol dehydrogenase family)
MGASPLNVDMKGKITLVTGATSGIGKEIARGLARMGATVIIGARSEERGKATQEEIAKDTGNSAVSTMIVDVASVKSMRAFAAAFLAKHDKLHVLMNNAGAWFSDMRQSPDGYELCFATNVLGPYLLGSLLEPALRAAAPSRVINVASDFASDYDATDVEWKRRKYDGFKQYAATKQAIRMLTFGHAARLQGSGVTVNTAAPGFVRTELNQNASGAMAFFINVSAKLFALTPEKGADTLLWTAVAPELATTTGKFFAKRAEKESKFREPGPIAELEKICEGMVAAKS